MKILFWWNFDKAKLIWNNYRDGHRKAIEELGKIHDVTWHLGTDVPSGEGYNFLLFWDDSNSEVFNHLDKYKCRKGICLTTDPHNMDNLRKLDVVFVESEPIFQAVRREGIRCIRAFGTDTDYFHPKSTVKKTIDYFYPATFSPWKCQSAIAYLGPKLTCVGTVQPDGQDELRECLENGVIIEEGYFPVEKIRDYYWKSETVIIPAIHGSERTVLEAMACGIKPLVLNPSNVRTKSYILEYDEWKKLNPDGNVRQFVLEKYSHKQFTEALRKGIENA